MGFNEEYQKLRKKRLNGEETPSTAADLKAPRLLYQNKTLTSDDDIAPVVQTKEEEDERSWFQKGAFSDGYQFGDIFKTVESTARDLEENIMAGVLGIGESVVDAGAYIAGGVGGLFGADDFADDMKDFVAKDLYDEKKVAQTILAPRISSLWTDTDKDSLLGEKAEGIAQSGGQLLGTAALQSVGVPWFLTTGVTSFGSETENAFSQGATYGEAGLSGLITAGAEILTEKISGGIKFGGSTLDDALTKKLATGISNKALRTMAKFGMDVVGEGSEEVLSQFFSNLGTALYKEENLGDILFSEEALDGYLESFIGGAALGGVGSGYKAVNSAVHGVDATSGLTGNEEAVFQYEYNNRIAEAEESGKKLSAKDKRKIYDEVMEDLGKGEISVDTIETALGGDTYMEYKNTIYEEDNLQRELDELGDMKESEFTAKQRDRYNELKQLVADNKANDKRGQLKKQLSENVFSIAKDSARLSESYKEKEKRSQVFVDDLTRYDDKEKEIVQKAMDSGILNNTNRTHEFVSTVAKIAADKGVSFDFTNNEKLKESGFAVDGAEVNGFVTKDGITINMDSHKAWQSTVGHEIAHVLEGTELYAEMQKALFDYAKTKGDYQSRYDSLTKLYANVKDANIDAELTADLVGDYLFTDEDFVRHLSTQNRNVFQKVYDEIKHLLKLVTAGSKEARQLEKVKHAFDKAYKEGGKASEGTKYSMSEIANVDSDGKTLTKEQGEYFKDSKMRDDNGNLKVMYHGSQDAGFHVFDPSMSDDDTSFFFVDRNDVAASYSGTTETYEAQTIRTAEDMNKFIESIGVDGYEVVEKDGKFTLLYEGDRVADSDTAQGIYDEFCWYEGVGEGDANYKVYLNLTNPLEVDAKGRPWNKIDAEFSQEVYDKYNSLTEEEKAALTDLAEWEDFRIFNSEIQEATGNELASAYAKMGEDCNIYDLFSVAADNFSEESMRENARHYLKTRDFAQRAKEQGYDGVIFKNLIDNGGYSNGSEGASTVAIAFDSNQIKSVANAKPTGNADIRYSLSEDSEGRTLSDEQKKYFNGSKVVDDNGNLKVVYHGTPNGDFSVFKDGSYFTENKWYADLYQNPGASSISTGKVATNPKTFEVYLDIKKPFDINDAEARSIYINDYIKGGNAVGVNPYLSDAEYDKIDTIDWTEGEDLRDFLIDHGYDYDGLVLDEGAVGGYGDEVKYRGKSYVVFSPEQVKSVDNPKPTSNPDIRYSLTEYTAEEKKAHNDAVLEHFGKTYKWAETGYLLLDGTKLDLSGKHDGAPGGYRTVDHRDITEALGYDYGGGNYSDSLIQFMGEGNIRIVPEIDGINLSVKPTKAQEQALSEYISRARGEVVLDIDDLNGNTVVSVEYPRGTYHTKILNDIREWFDNGKKPEVSGLSSFRSLTKKGEALANRGRFSTPARDLRLEAQEEFAPVNEVAPEAETPTVSKMEQVADYAPITEDEANALQSEIIENLTDADAPPEMEDTYYGEENDLVPDNPFENRDIKAVGKRNVKAYMYENPEVKPFFQKEARVMLGELYATTKGERFYTPVEGGVPGEYGAESYGVWTGVSRHTTPDIEYLLDTLGYSYAEIEKGLNAIIEDHGEENNACSKRIEFLLNDRLRNGYMDVFDGYEIPADQDYINLLNEKQIMEYSEEARKQFFDVADDYAPQEDIGPVTGGTTETTTKETYEAIKPKREPSNEPRMKRVKADDASADGKQRKWVGTSTESEAVDGKVLPEDLDQDAIHYQPITNKETLRKANEKLNNMGYDSSLSYFNSQFANKKTSVEDVVLGERLIQEAIKRGDTKTAGELIQDVSILGTELGQKVQALSIIKRLTPEGQLRMLRRTVERGKTKGEKSFEGVEITQEMIDHILKTYGKDGSYDQAKLNEAVEDVKQQIADQMNVTKLEKANAWRYLSMLGNPKTHIRNLVSNVAMRGTLAVKNAVARTIEDIAPVENRTKTWKAASDDVKAFAQQTAIEMKDVLSDGGKYNEEASIKEKRQMFKNNVLNKVYNLNSELLSKEDWWFSKPAFTNALQEYLTANGISTAEDIKNNPNVIAKAKQYATEQSQIATFRQYSWLANKINEIERKNTATNIAVGAVLPFKKTPINIAKTALNYSPLGFAKTLTYDASQVKNGKMEASEMVDHLAQNLTGTALTLAGYMLASAGFLNGAGDDDKEGKYDYQLGEQAYSVNIGDATFSLSWLSPIAMPLFVGANAYEQLVEGKEWNGDVVMETLAQTLDPLSEMSFLSSLDSVLSSYDSGIQKFAGIAQSAAQSYATQFVPTLSSQVAATLDDTKRTTKVAADSDFKFVDETINSLKYKIPFLRQTLEPSTDIWGNEVKQSENLITRAFESFIAPYAKRENIATQIDEEIKDLYAQTGDNGVIPSIPYNYVNYDGEKYEMSAEEYTEYKKIYGQTAYDIMSDLFSTEVYQNASSEERADMVNRVYDYARDEAKRELLAKYGVDFTNATADGEEVYKENSIIGAIENNMTPSEYGFFEDSPEKYEFLKENGVSYEDYKNGSEEFKDAYSWAYKNPEKFTMSKAVSDDVVVYRQYASELYDIKADKDENGKSISGSRKEKVIDYVNSLDIDYGARLILFKNEYNADDTYNYDIIDYLNSREDISYEDMETILKELGFNVDSKGNISWD